MSSQSRNEATPAPQGQRELQVRAAQIRLLYTNSNTGIGVTIIAAPVLGGLQWTVVDHATVLGWLAYMLLVSAGRWILSGWYRRSSPHPTEIGRWGRDFALGAGLAAAGWGAAGFLLYPEAQLVNQVFLLFVLGGMMLGAASLLAPRREAFLAFLLPTGLLPAIRLLYAGDKEHVAMGMLATLFTVATLTTTWRFHRTIESSFGLHFENEELVADLQIAKNRTEEVNQQLEVRVQERTAELYHSAERLKAEIAQREKTEEELLRVRNLESLGVLAGGIAHDFNNFLTIVQGNIELAKMRLHPGAPVREILDQTESACERAVFLSSQLLTFASGGAPIRRVVAISKLVLDAVQLARAGAPVSITVDLAQDLWPAEVDSGQIGQVLHNVLLNAKQAMPEGGIIEVCAENMRLGGAEERNAERHVRISIRDYGCGIPAETLPRIFDPYFTTKRSGSGLGLATAYAIVNRHGGHLSAQSKYGEGTTFTIDLPASQSSPVPESAVGAVLRGGTGRLLVMDDEEALRKLLLHILTPLGYEVQTAGDGAEAIALYEAAKTAGRGFDAVLLDLTVTGGMGGLEAARALRELDPTSKLIVSSGYSDAPVMSSFRAYGFDAVLPKPFTAAQISELFQRVLAPGGVAPSDSTTGN